MWGVWESAQFLPLFDRPEALRLNFTSQGADTSRRVPPDRVPGQHRSN